jgi:hypothetical protein
MTFQNCIPTAHFNKRLQDRKLPSHAVDLALRFGKKIHNKGALFRILTDQLCELYRLPSSYRGITVVLDAQSGSLITVYRHHGKSLKYFRKGVKYDFSASKSRKSSLRSQVSWR